MAKYFAVKFRKIKGIAIIKGYNEENLKPDSSVVVETNRGIEYGEIGCYCCERGRMPLIDIKLRKVLRYANDKDIEHEKILLQKEKDAAKIVNEKINEYKTPIKLIELEYLFDESKLYIYYKMLETKNPFSLKELVKDLSNTFKIKIEMQHVSPRDEASFIGGIGPCGKPLCCAQFLSEFPHVTVKLLKEQGIQISGLKTSGICGKLLCCLKYEYVEKNNDK